MIVGCNVDEHFISSVLNCHQSVISYSGIKGLILLGHVRVVNCFFKLACTRLRLFSITSYSPLGQSAPDGSSGLSVCEMTQ